MSQDYESRSRNVTAVLGPTNTGKTHLAIERMLGHDTGMIGLPLRLLAREVYDRIVSRVGADKVALVTGEEKIRPESPRFWVATVEAMPLDVETDFLAIDEIQLCADPERGHVFTDRLLHARGTIETLLLGAGTMRDAIADLIPGANFISRPRLSKLTYAGQKKITRLPKRSAVVAFSSAEVYAIAELIRRQLGGAAVVLGALSPRTRNAQVALYQSGDVDYLVATDAIGMGLNLDVDHVAFAAIRKFDGQAHRNLTPGELGQIAGRAGRHLNDGTFGITADVEPFEHDLIERLETHTFDPIRTLEWRNRALDFQSVDALRDSLRQLPREHRLRRARMADDVLALETLSADREVMALATTRSAVAELWEACQIPDYRRISSANHAELIGTLYKFVKGADGRIPEDWFAKQVAFSDRTDGDIDTLSNRLAHIRTWTFVANRPGWLADPAHWQERTRAIEDSLSDALHDCLTQRFVDKRTSALMRGLRDKEEMTADIAEDGAIKVQDHFVGRLRGFRFTADALGDSSIHGKAMRQAAGHVVSKEIAMRARRVAAAKADAFKLTRTGGVFWRDEEIARLEASDDPLKPTVVLLADEHLTGPDKEKVQERLQTWVGEIVGDRLKPLVEIARAEDVTGLARGIAFRLVEQLGVLKRETVAEEVKALDQNARAQLRKYGVRFGAFNIYFPLLLKPAASELRLTLWSLKQAASPGFVADAMPAAPRPGLTSLAADPSVPEDFYRAYGFHVCGPRAVRVDMLERLADLIRPLVAWRPAPDAVAEPPRGATGDGGFRVIPEMMSILGCSTEELAGVLKSLGFWVERRPVRRAAPKPTVGGGAPPTPVTEASASPAFGEPEAARAEADAAGHVQDTGAIASAQPLSAEPAISAAPDAVETEAEAAPLDRHAAGEAPTAAEHSETIAPATSVPSDAQPLSPTSDPVRAGDPEAAAEPLSAEAVQPEIEEVWRPRRRGRGEGREHARGQGEGRDRRHRRGRGPSERRDGPSSPGQGQPRGLERHAGGRRRPPAAQPAAAAPTDAPGRTSEASPLPVAAAPERGREDRQGEGPRERRPDRSEHRPRQDERDRRREANRERDERRRHERQPFVARSGPPPRKGGIDPDSPFAALGALRQALEQKARDQSK